MSDTPIQIRDSQTLRYRSTAHKNVPRDTVRVNITINALVGTSDRDHAALLQRMRETLKRFIPVEWVLTAPRREADSSGFERITVGANARAPLAENYNLAERARLAGSEGLYLTEPQVNHRLPGAKVAAAVHQLRIDLMNEAMAQAESFKQSSGLNWQLADIEFGVGSLRSEQTNFKGAYREEMDDMDDDVPAPAAERIRLVASVILKVEAAAAR